MNFSLSDGVHVIHQLTAAGRTLVAILLNCHAESLRPLISPALEALRSCVGLLRRFSGRYVCGLRSGDLMEEFCRRESCPFSGFPSRLNLASVTQIPLEASRHDTTERRSRPPWIRPVRKKTPSVAHSNASNESPPHHSSPESFSPSDAFLDLTGGASTSPAPFSPASNAPSARSLAQNAYVLGNSVLDGGPPPPYLENGNVDMISSESALSISSSDILALFNDGGVDVAALLMSPDITGRRVSESHHSSDFYASIAGSGLEGSAAAGLVSP